MCTLAKILTLLLALVLPCAVRADSAALEQAERLFQQGEWEKARQAYAAELAAQADPALLPSAFFYNYGTVLAKAGSAAEAYVALTRAAFAHPFDSDTRVNLGLAAQATSGAALSVRPALWYSWWPSSWRFVPWQAWLCLGLLLSALALGLPRGKFPAATTLLGSAGLCWMLIAALAYAQALLPVHGVMKPAKVRSGPGASFPEITALDPGALLNVEEMRDGWLKVRFARGDSAELVGWLEPAATLPVR